MVELMAGSSIMAISARKAGFKNIRVLDWAEQTKERTIPIGDGKDQIRRSEVRRPDTNPRRASIAVLA